VVTTPLGAAGLAVQDGRHLLLAGTPPGLAAAAARVLDDQRLGDNLRSAAAALVRNRYSHEAVIPAIRRFWREAATAGPHASSGLERPRSP
jgi:glycosyltransferase involved in cell wall biosynthesis